jgi:hypothetical protein
LGVRTYGQYCPIARASDLLAERWSIIILRNILIGCRTFNEIADPGGEEELVVVVRDPVAFARWHLGEAEWGDALRCGAIEVTGSSTLARALPTWNRRIQPGQHQLPTPATAPEPLERV